jgi:hypothetical protein
LLSDYFNNVFFDKFYIREQLIISLSAYEYDEDVGNYLSTNLLTKLDLNICLLAALRYFLETNANKSFVILNVGLVRSTFLDESYRKTLYYLMRLILEKLGFEFIRVFIKNYLDNTSVTFKELYPFLENLNILIYRGELNDYYSEDSFSNMIIDLILNSYRVIVKENKYSFTDKQTKDIKYKLIDIWKNLFVDIITKSENIQRKTVVISPSVLQKILFSYDKVFNDRSDLAKAERILLTFYNVFELTMDQKTINEDCRIPLSYTDMERYSIKTHS